MWTCDTPDWVKSHQFMKQKSMMNLEFFCWWLRLNHYLECHTLPCTPNLRKKKCWAWYRVQIKYKLTAELFYKPFVVHEKNFNDQNRIKSQTSEVRIHKWKFLNTKFSVYYVLTFSFFNLIIKQIESCTQENSIKRIHSATFQIFIFKSNEKVRKSPKSQVFCLFLFFKKQGHSHFRLGICKARVLYCYVICKCMGLQQFTPSPNHSNI